MTVMSCKTNNNSNNTTQKKKQLESIGSAVTDDCRIEKRALFFWFLKKREKREKTDSIIALIW